MHSGCTTGEVRSSWSIPVKPEHYFQTPYNQHLSLEAIDAIAKSCKEHMSACWGIGVLNEYERDMDETDLESIIDYFMGKDKKLLKFLHGYYDAAIKKARETLALDVPVVLFSWDMDLWYWTAEHFSDYKTYGKIVFDTHEYQFTLKNFARIAAWKQSTNNAYDLIFGEVQISEENIPLM